MAGRAKAVSDEYKSALVDLTFNSKPMINLLTMLAEENNEYAQPIVNVICERIKTVGTEQKMPALYLLDSILKNIGREYCAIIAKHIVEVFCCVFESAPDERRRMQLFKLRNTWNQYIPNKTLYELDVRVTRTDPNWPVAAPVATSSPSVIHVNPKFLQKNDPTASPITATLAASIVAEKEASKLQSKINKQRLLEEEKRVQEQLRILQADKLKRDREQHELMLQQQQQERERLIAEQKRQLEVLRKQQQNMIDPSVKTQSTSTAEVESKVVESKVVTSKAKMSELKPEEQNVTVKEEEVISADVAEEPSFTVTNKIELDGIKSEKQDSDITTTATTMTTTTITTTAKAIPTTAKAIPTAAKAIPTTAKAIPTTAVTPVIPHSIVKDSGAKNDVTDPRLNRKKGVTNKSAVNVLNKIVTNLSKGKPDAVPQVTPVRKIRPLNPIYARSPVSIATASQSFASTSFNTLNLSVSPSGENSPLDLSPSTSPKDIAKNDNVQITSSNSIVPVSSSPVVIASSVVSCVTSSVTHSPSKLNTNSNLIVVHCHNDAMTSHDIVADKVKPLSVTAMISHNKVADTVKHRSVTKSQHKELVIDRVTSSPITLPTCTASIDDHSVVKSTACSSASPHSKSVACATVSPDDVIIISEDATVEIKTSTGKGAPILQSTSNSSQLSHKTISISSTSENQLTSTMMTTAAATTTTATTGETPAVPSVDVPPPFSGEFKSLSTRDMHIAAQAAAIATAMHQMQSGPGSSGVMAPEQSAQLAAQLIEIMKGQASAISTGTTSTTSTASVTSTVNSHSNNIKDTTDVEGNDKKKQLNDKLMVTEINEMVARERLASSNASVAQSDEKVRDRSPHDSDSKRKTGPTEQQSEGKDDDKSRSKSRDEEKLRSPERNLRSRTRERDKRHVILGDEPPSKRLKDADPQERGRKARARSPSRYYNRMERKIVSEKRVEEKEKELVLQRFRKFSDGDGSEQSKDGNEKTSSSKERTSPDTEKKVGDDDGLEIHEKEFNMLKERLYDIHKNIEKTGAIDQDTLTKIMVEIDHKAKDGILSKKYKDDLMWEIRHIRAEAKHVGQKHGAKKGHIDNQDPAAPNAHLHWRSRKDHSHDIPQVAPERFGRPRGPRERFGGPVRPVFQNHDGFGETTHIHEPMEEFDEQRHGPPPEYVGDGPPHYQDGRQLHLQNRPPNMHEEQLPPHMRNNPHGSFMDERGPHHGSHGPGPPYNSNEHPQNMGGNFDGPNTHMMDGPRMPHMMDGPRPPHMMDGPRPPHMMGEPRPPPHMMDGPRPPPHMMDGPRPPHMMDGPRPHHMDGPRPPNMMDGPQPPHMIDGSRPPHFMDGPRPPLHRMDGPRPPHMMDGPRPPHMMDGPRPPHMIDGPRPGHMMDGHRPPHMMDGPHPPHMMEGPLPPHAPQNHGDGAPHLNVHQAHMSRPPHMDGPRHPHMDGPRHPHMDGPRHPHMDGPRPPHPPLPPDVPRPPHMDAPRPPHMDAFRPPHIDGPRPPHMMEGPHHMIKAPHPSSMLRPHHMGDVPRAAIADGHQPPLMMEMSNPAYRMERPPGHGPQPPFMREGMQVGHPMSQSEIAQSSQPIQHHQHGPHPQHSGMQHTQVHPSFHVGHGNMWAANTFHPTVDAVSSSSNQHTFDVSSLLGQLSAAGLLPMVGKTEPEQVKQEVPEIKLVLEDLKVRNNIVIGNIMIGKQCSSCGERFPSEVHSEHLDWHFRQNRKEKGGARKDCRQWYFDLKDWIEQNTRKVYEDVKPVAVVPANKEEVKIESTEEVVPSQTEDTQKLASDDSIPVGAAGEVCHVCMDPLEQYWDEDREEWRYRKAVREQNRTYHYHCYADYVPFELEEEPATPESPLSPHPPPPIEDKDFHEGQLDDTCEMEISSESNTLESSTGLNTSTDMNITDLNVTMQHDTSRLSDACFSRLTVSMMEVISPVAIDVELPGTSDTPTASPTEKGNTTSNVDTEKDVLNTIQDILRVASFNMKVSKPKDAVATNAKEADDASLCNTQDNEKESDIEQEVSALLAEMVDIVSKRLLVRESKSFLMLPFVSSIIGCSEEIKGRREEMSLDTKNITPVIENNDSTLCNKPMDNPGYKPIEPGDDNEIITDYDKKELDEEPDIVFSPYIENMDSPVYPVITTSNLACVEQEDDTKNQMEKMIVTDFPDSVVLPTQSGCSISLDLILADVAETMERLISEVVLNLQSVSCENENSRIFNDDSLSVIKLEPVVKDVNEVCLDFNRSVKEVINNITVDE